MGTLGDVPCSAPLGEGTVTLNGAGDPESGCHPFPWAPDLLGGGLAFSLRNVRSRQVKARRPEAQAAPLAPR